MNALQRWVLRRCRRRLERYLRAQGVLRTVKHKPALVWEPGGGNVLVLAPHMDDETIGCGGTLVKHARRGAHVTVLFLTDGRGGSNALRELAGDERRSRERELVELRKHEARLALDVLGVREAVFLEVPEATLDSTRAIDGRLRDIVRRVGPDLVYVPSFFEDQPDHAATARILVDATRDPEFGFECCAYEVWSPLWPNCLVQIDDAIAEKRRALEQYRSQLVDKDYLHTALGLNAYRSAALLRRGPAYAEAFLRTSLADHRRLYDAYRRSMGTEAQA